VSGNPVDDYLGRIHREILPNRDGVVADYIPELARVDPDPFGLALATLDGEVYAAGDSAAAFTIQSASKPFVMALAIQDRGVDTLLGSVGVEPTGDPFNAVTLEPDTGRPFNPMVNAGAIVASTLVAGDDEDERSRRIVTGLSAFAGRALQVDEQVLSSELATADRNRALAFLMRSMGSLREDVEPTLEVYFRQCSVLVTAEDLAMMGSTLANGGRNPRTGAVVVDQEVVTYVLSVMITCGLYDFSGEWMFRTGLPAKSGVGGGIAVVLPGEFGIGTYSPRLDAQGNSIRGVAACEAMSRRLGLHVMRPHRQEVSPLHRRLDGGRVRSRRARPAQERAALESARAIVIYELQGDLTFTEAELVSRQMAAESPRWLILDLSRLTRMDAVATSLLRNTSTALAVRGVQVMLAGAAGRATDVAGDVFPTAADAVEACEDALVSEAGLSSLENEVPVADNDLCAYLSREDVTTLLTYGSHSSFTRGEVVDQDATLRQPLMFITRGCIGLEPQLDPALSASAQALSRFTSRSAGTAVGSLAAAGGAMSTRLVALTDVAVFGFTDAALDGLNADHPRVAAALYRAAAEALAAEPRWLAAENVALSS